MSAHVRVIFMRDLCTCMCVHVSLFVQLWVLGICVCTHAHVCQRVRTPVLPCGHMQRQVKGELLWRRGMASQDDGLKRPE